MYKRQALLRARASGVSVGPAPQPAVSRENEEELRERTFIALCNLREAGAVTLAQFTQLKAALANELPAVRRAVRAHRRALRLSEARSSADDTESDDGADGSSAGAAGNKITRCLWSMGAA